MKCFKQFNESIRDKMSPVSEEDIRKKMGDEQYNIYRKLNDAIDSIKPPFEIGENYTNNRNFPNSFKIIIWYIRFEIRYDGVIWTYIYDYNGEKEPLTFNSWDDVYNEIKSDTKKSFNNEIKSANSEIKRYQENIADIKNVISEIN